MAQSRVTVLLSTKVLSVRTMAVRMRVCVRAAGVLVAGKLGSVAHMQVAARDSSQQVYGQLHVLTCIFNVFTY
jgi:hypothetical protein